MRKIKPFAPKPGAPGSRIEYAPSANSEQRCTGTVWSAGPLPNSCWVQPDDDPTNQVVVKLPTPGKSGLMVRISGAGVHDTAESQRRLIKVCDRVHAAGFVFGVRDYKPVDLGGWFGNRGQKPVFAVSWHVDQQCPTVEGKERHIWESTDEPAVIAAGQALDKILGRTDWPLMDKLCRVCVWQDLVQHFSYDWPPFGRLHVWRSGHQVMQGYEGKTPEILTLPGSDLDALECVDEMSRQESKQRGFRVEDTPVPVWLSEQASGVAA